MKIVLWGALGLVVAVSLHRLASWAEKRGWIYYREKRGRAGTLGNALLEVQTLLEPSKRHVLEERRRDVAEEPDSGDPPRSAAGRGSDRRGKT